MIGGNVNESNQINKQRGIKQLIRNFMFHLGGMNDDTDNLAAIESAIRENGYKEKECVFYTYNGKLMNESYELSGCNSYPDDLTFVSIPNFYNPMFKIAYGARWFDDIVDNNEMREMT